jgi:hypothetical protein
VAEAALKSSEVAVDSAVAKHNVVAVVLSREWAKIVAASGSRTVEAVVDEVDEEVVTETIGHSEIVMHPFRSGLTGICLRRSTLRVLRS